MTEKLIDRRIAIFLVILFAAVVLIPMGNLLAAPGSGLHVPSYMVALLGKYLCYALLAVALDLCWGYAGILSLGIANKFLEPWAGAVLGKILILVFIILFIQKKPRGLFPQRGRAVEA